MTFLTSHARLLADLSNHIRTIRTLASPLVRTRKESSADSAQIERTSKELKQKYDKTLKILKSTKVSNKLFLIEGKTLLREAIQSENIKIHKIFYTGHRLSPEWVKEVQSSLTTKKRMFEVTEKLMNSWSDVKTSQGVIAFAEACDPESFKTGSSLPFTLLLDNVREPGNTGTIIRTAACIGCERILLSKGCVQPWSTKVVRASMGGLFQLPVHSGLSLPDIQGILKKTDTILIADSKESTSTFQHDLIKSLDYTDLDIRQLPANVVLIIGNEATGISQGLGKILENLAGEKKPGSIVRVKIPLSNRMESLNCSIAFGVLGYEIRRQLLNSDSEHASQQMLSLN